MVGIDESVELSVRDVQILQRRQSMRATLVVVLALATGMFVLPNRQPILVDWVMGTVTAPLYRILIGTWVSGVVVGVLLASASTRHALGAFALRSRRRR